MGTCHIAAVVGLFKSVSLLLKAHCTESHRFVLAQPTSESIFFSFIFEHLV